MQYRWERVQGQPMLSCHVSALYCDALSHRICWRIGSSNAPSIPYVQFIFFYNIYTTTWEYNKLNDLKQKKENINFHLNVMKTGKKKKVKERKNKHMHMIARIVFACVISHIHIWWKVIKNTYAYPNHSSKCLCRNDSNL